MIFFALLALLFSGSVIAQDDVPLLNFKFNHLSVLNSLAASADSRDSGFGDSESSDPAKVSQYDMTLSYPWLSNKVNIGLGLTLRHISKFKNNESQSTLPLFHASALYNFSFRGLSAGLEGNHAGSVKNRLFDYKAKVSYEWRKGFGMQGGWQHQQFKQDKSAASLSDNALKGPYLDFYLNF